MHENNAKNFTSTHTLYTPHDVWAARCLLALSSGADTL